MAREFHLPDVGEGLVEAVIVSWHVEVGETVGLDEPLVEVETDKALTEIESPADGILAQIVAPVGTDVNLGEPLGILKPQA